ADLEQELGEHLRVRRVQSRRRLVQEQERRLEREGARELETLLRAERQVAGGLALDVREAEKFHQLLRLLANQALLPAGERQRQAFRQDARADVAVLRHQHVVERREAPEELHVLERARDAEAGNLIRPETGDVRLAKQDV